MQLDKIQNTSPKIPELIMQSLIGAIEAGHIHVGEELPSERELAESLGLKQAPTLVVNGENGVEKIVNVSNIKKYIGQGRGK